MTTTGKKYFIYQNDQVIEVNQETYQAYYRPIWKTYKTNLRRGQCKLKDWRKCKGDCALCIYAAEGKTISLDAAKNSSNETIFSLLDQIADSSPSPLAIIENNELIDSLYTSLNALEQFEQDICKLYMNGLSEREIAADLNIPRSTFKYRWKKILEKLSENLKNFI